MFPLLQLGPLAIQLPGLFLLVGIWIGTWIIDKEAPRQGISATTLNNLVFIALVAGIIGARLGYAARYLNIYADDPLSLIALNPSTLAPAEGIFIGLLAAVIYGQRRELPFWPTLDALAPSLAVFAIAYGFSHLSSGDAFGAISDVPWAIEMWDERRHPSQIYEILGAIMILLTLWRIRSLSTFPGFLILSLVGLSATSRLLLEAYRGDSVVILSTIRSAQVVSLIILLASLGALHLLARRRLSSAKL